MTPTPLTWTPQPGERVLVHGSRRTTTPNWWGAEVRTVAPPYVRVVRLVNGVARLETYRIDQIRRSA